MGRGALSRPAAARRGRLLRALVGDDGHARVPPHTRGRFRRGRRLGRAVFPARAPDFASSLGFAGRPRRGAPSDAPALRRSSGGTARVDRCRGCGRLVGDAPGRSRSPSCVRPRRLRRVAAVGDAGLCLALLYLALTIRVSDEPRTLASPRSGRWQSGSRRCPSRSPPCAGTLGARRGPRGSPSATGCSSSRSLAATRIEPPELTALGQDGWTTLVDLAGLVALVVSALAFRAAGAPARPSPALADRRRSRHDGRHRRRPGACLAGPTDPAHPHPLRSPPSRCGREPSDRPGREILRSFRGCSPAPRCSSSSSSRRCASTPARPRPSASPRAIRLPDPQRPSTGAVVAAQQAADRLERFDLVGDLPAPPDETDLSDLAYRIWRDGAEGPEGDALASYEIVRRRRAAAQPLLVDTRSPSARGELSGRR